jgi:hypothetical protein
LCWSLVMTASVLYSELSACLGPGPTGSCRCQADIFCASWQPLCAAWPLVVGRAGSGPAALARLGAVVALEQGAVDHVAHVADLHNAETALNDAEVKDPGASTERHRILSVRHCVLCQVLQPTMSRVQHQLQRHRMSGHMQNCNSGIVPAATAGYILWAAHSVCGHELLKSGCCTKPKQI